MKIKEKDGILLSIILCIIVVILAISGKMYLDNNINNSNDPKNNNTSIETYSTLEAFRIISVFLILGFVVLAFAGIRVYYLKDKDNKEDKIVETKGDLFFKRIGIISIILGLLLMGLAIIL